MSYNAWLSGFAFSFSLRPCSVACELDERVTRGRCPYRAACGSPFCPHAARCFVCDAWSCGECRLTRGDGEDVAELAHDLRRGRGTP
jgi:hypothetical protein